MEAVEGQPCGYVCPVCPVQAPVDALPAPEDVTAGNCAGVEAQLAAVDEARAGLTDEEARRLDVSRYQAVVSALSALDGQAGADTPTLLADNVPYLDAGGNTETCAAATEVTSGNTSWSAGWYVVSGDVTISDPIAIAGDGDVHLILANGCTLNAEKGIVMSNVNLSIYAQSDGQDMGKLTASNDSGPKSIAIGPPIGGKGSGHITICGGHITATAVGEGSCGILIGDLDIYNGTIAATGNQYGIYGLRDYVSIRNGTVEATATAETGHGIYLPSLPALGSDIGGKVVIEGGTVTATGGANGSGICVASPINSVTISGGTIVAAGGDGIRSNFTTGMDGSAFITASSIADGSDKGDWRGVIFEGDQGLIYGDSATLGTNAEVLSGKTLTIKDGQTLTIPAGMTLINNGTIIVESGGKLVGTVVNNGSITDLNNVEQFPSLTPGGTYWFDLFGEGIPGSVNGSMPDTTLHWVPFTYAGTINAYNLKSEQAPTEEYANQNKYDHSLFVADYNVTHTISWNELNAGHMIFGTNYASGGVDYTMRAPSEGSYFSGVSGGVPMSNEWDVLLSKNTDYIKNWNGLASWGQDTIMNPSGGSHDNFRIVRGKTGISFLAFIPVDNKQNTQGFRPVLELPDPNTLPSGLKVVTLKLNGGKIGSETGPVSIVVKFGGDFTAPSGEGLTAPAGKVFGGWKSGDVVYQADDNVPGSVTDLTAYWLTKPSITTQPKDISVSVGEQATFTAAASGEPSPACKWQVSKDNGGTWEDIFGAAGSSYTTEKATMSMNGWQYQCVASNSAGSATSDAATLTVTPPSTQYTITATAGSGGSISPSSVIVTAGGGTYAENASAKVTAAARAGYHFVKWTEDGREVSTDASIPLP